MNIYLLNENKEMTDAWEKFFGDKPVSIINDNFEHFMKTHPNIDCIVSSANSFGLMDGGYDAVIIEYLGEDARKKILNKIHGTVGIYQTPGTSIAVQVTDNINIIHTPTMRTPEEIVDKRIIFDCMYSCLRECRENGFENIVIPAFGVGVGNVSCDTVAEYMAFAYNMQHSFLTGNNSSVDNNVLWQFAGLIAHALKNIGN